MLVLKRLVEHRPPIFIDLTTFKEQCRRPKARTVQLTEGLKEWRLKCYMTKYIYCTFTPDTLLPISLINTLATDSSIKTVDDIKAADPQWLFLKVHAQDVLDELKKLNDELDEVAKEEGERKKQKRDEADKRYRENYNASRRRQDTDPAKPAFKFKPLTFAPPLMPPPADLAVPSFSGHQQYVFVPFVPCEPSESSIPVTSSSNTTRARASRESAVPVSQPPEPAIAGPSTSRALPRPRPRPRPVSAALRAASSHAVSASSLGAVPVSSSHALSPLSHAANHSPALTAPHILTSTVSHSLSHPSQAGAPPRTSTPLQDIPLPSQQRSPLHAVFEGMRL